SGAGVQHCRKDRHSADSDPRRVRWRKTIASFVGWGPVDDPRFIVLVKLDKPSASIWGSATAAPTFGEMVKRLVVLMNIPPDDVRHQMAAQTAGQ
ncbi:MAG: hypothetical protein AABZ58_11045, partial [Chloroflexota bacterium]